MNICKVFIERPVATTVLILALFIFGCLAYPKLAINELPNVDFPTIRVTASLPGTDPQTMAATVATPIEKELSTIAGIDSMSSISTDGFTKIMVQFKLNRNIDSAAQDVQSALLQVARHLPSQMTNPPTVTKVNPTDLPILYLALTANNLPMTKVDDYAENQIAPRLSMIDGVAEVNVFGAQQYAVRIHLNPAALVNRNLSVQQVAEAIQAVNTNQPLGTLQSEGYYRLIKVNGQLNNAQQFANAVIASRNGAPIRLSEVARVENSVANDQSMTWYNNQRSIVLAIQRQPGANTVEVVNQIFKILPKLEAGIPGGAKIRVVYDRAAFIKTSIKDVQFTLIFAAFLVVAVIFLFLRNISSTLIAVFSLPISIVATFGLMYVFQFSLDNLSLMGLVLAVGFVIDDAVVVLENIMRHVESGLDRLSASLRGSQEIGFTIIAMTLSLVAVFIPIFFMGGIVGRLFQEFAAVVGIAILISGVVSLTLVPMLCSRFINVKKHEEQSSAKFTEYFKKNYEKSLRWAMSHLKTMLAASLVILLAMGLLFYFIPKGFIPSEDTGVIFGNVEAPEGITYPNFLQEQQMVANIIQQNPNVKALISSVGQGQDGSVSTNTGHLAIRLQPLGERKLTADQVIQQLRKQLQSVTGLKVFLVNPPAIQVGGKIANSNYKYVLQSTSWSELKNAAAIMKERMAQIKGLQDVDSDLEMNNPELKLHILRDKAALLGITPEQIENVLYSAYGQRQVSDITTATGDYDVIMDIDPAYQKNPSDLNQLYLRSSVTQQMVPLTALVTQEESAGPLTVNHYGQLPAVVIAFNVTPGYSLGHVTQQIQNIAKQILPPNISGSFIGTAQKFQESLSSLPLLLLFTVLIIYMVLAILYEHFGHPITILTALPFAAFGALMSLMVFHQQLDIFSFIGLIMLVGLTKKNGIMMVDFAIEAKREQNLSAKEAIIQACCIRFRPIMMTTLAALVATAPIAFGFGAGGETRQGLGIAVVGGLLFSQLITLYITPIFYVLVDKFTTTKQKQKDCLLPAPENSP